jgi:hypothetical protein
MMQYELATTIFQGKDMSCTPQNFGQRFTKTIYESEYLVWADKKNLILRNLNLLLNVVLIARRTNYAHFNHVKSWMNWNDGSGYLPI